MADFAKLDRIHDRAERKKMDEYYDTHFPDTDDCSHCNHPILPDEQLGEDCKGNPICESCMEKIRDKAEAKNEGER